jgi:hypothetical protein
MAGKPFRTVETPLRNVNEKHEAAAAEKGTHVVHSQKTGEPLPCGEADTPAKTPDIAWPQPVLGVDHKPMKLK